MTLFPELDAVMEQTGMTAGDVANYFNSLASAQDNSGASAEDYTAKLSDLSETISGMKSAYDLLDTVQEEMNATGGLSADAIAKLASSCDNYMDFLYEENGLIKLNTEAWRENAEAKIRSDMTAIQQEIVTLEEQNRLLQEQMNGVDGSTGYQSQALTDAVLLNNRAIAALESGNIEEYKKLRAEYEEIAPLVKNIEAIMERPVSANWQTVYGDSTDYIGYKAWEILENEGVFSVAIGPGSSGGVVDNLKEMMSINETYQEASKNMVSA